MRDVYAFIARVAPTDSTVLLRGESGTGKELVARAMHRNSPRAAKPFVAINCATLSEMLLESELFGHERGAFTGAIAQKRGKLELAHGGTVFLDEIAEIVPALQAKLLRVLQEREFERVGGTRPIRLDVRFVAATNQDLDEALRLGRFRQDLFYRLNVVSLTLPPLRDRREDIPLIANAFLEKFARRCKRRLRNLSPEARTALLRYDWPGNVRELENAIERAVVLAPGDRIRPEDLPESLLDGAADGPPNSPLRFHDALRNRKKELITTALVDAGGSYIEAARRLGLHPNYLHRLIRNLGMKSDLPKY